MSNTHHALSPPATLRAQPYALTMSHYAQWSVTKPLAHHHAPWPLRAHAPCSVHRASPMPTPCIPPTRMRHTPGYMHMIRNVSLLRARRSPVPVCSPRHHAPHSHPSSCCNALSEPPVPVHTRVQWPVVTAIPCRCATIYTRFVCIHSIAILLAFACTIGHGALE